MKAILFIVAVILISRVTSKIYQDILNPEEYVNILGGTESREDLSAGNTLPLITRPWGFNSYAPQTSTDPTYSSWWFHPNDRSLYGIRCTHQPSPWIGDYGQFVMKASIPVNAIGQDSSYSGYLPKKSIFTPYHFATELIAYRTATGQTIIEFTPSNHGGIMKAKFPTFVTSEIDAFIQTRRITIELNGNNDSSSITESSIDGTTMISGIVKTNSGGASAESNFGHYFVIMIYCGENGDKPVSFTTATSHSDSHSAWVDFPPENPLHEEFTLRFATSFISAEQALLNLQMEVDVNKQFNDVKLEAKNEWNKVLSRAVLSELDEDNYTPSEANDLYTTFYSAMYRASLFPRQLGEVASDGTTVHWSAYAKDMDSRVASGVASTDSGFWDAFSTVYPLLSLINRPVLGKTLQGWVNAYIESDWLPKWASPGFRGSMIGSMGDVTLADAIVKEIPNFDISKAYEAIRKDAFEIPPVGVDGVGRACLEAYIKYGYIPTGSSTTTGGQCDQLVSRNLNYLQADYAIAQAAMKLGYTDDSFILNQRAENYTKIFDINTGFFRSRLAENGKFREPFDQFAWGGDYTEAGPWQYRFNVPYDPKGLSDLFSKSGFNMCEELQKSQIMQGTFHIANYGNEIHEQTEFAENCWGQYSHNNQPSHYILDQFIASDQNGFSGACASLGQYWIRKALTTFYSPGNAAFSGDEDNGQMSSWYILQSIGLYALSPGNEDYILGSPLFDRVVIDISDTTQSNDLPSKKIEIIALNNSKDNVYVHKISWNGEYINEKSNSISYKLLKEGGTLQFEMSSKPKSMEI
jgi:predicted alpha-1,2-mannosidase